MLIKQGLISHFESSLITRAISRSSKNLKIKSMSVFCLGDRQRPARIISSKPYHQVPPCHRWIRLCCGSDHALTSMMMFIASLGVTQTCKNNILTIIAVWQLDGLLCKVKCEWGHWKCSSRIWLNLHEGVLRKLTCIPNSCSGPALSGFFHLSKNICLLIGSRIKWF